MPLRGEGRLWPPTGPFDEYKLRPNAVFEHNGRSIMWFLGMFGGQLLPISRQRKEAARTSGDTFGSLD